jgi:hypothetical protein
VLRHWLQSVRSLQKNRLTLKKNVMYDAVYEQEDYPFIEHKI